MKTFFTVLVIIGVVMPVTGAEARYDVQDHEMIKRILEFSSGNGTKVPSALRSYSVSIACSPRTDFWINRALNALT